MTHSVHSPNLGSQQVMSKGKAERLQDMWHLHFKDEVEVELVSYSGPEAVRSAEAAVELYGTMATTNNSEEAEAAYQAADNAVNAVVVAASSSGDGKGQIGKGSEWGMRRMYQEFVAGKKKGAGKQAGSLMQMA